MRRSTITRYASHHHCGLAHSVTVCPICDHAPARGDGGSTPLSGQFAAIRILLLWAKRPPHRSKQHRYFDHLVGAGEKRWGHIEAERVSWAITAAARKKWTRWRK